MLPYYAPIVPKSIPFFLYDGGFEEDLSVLSVRKRGEPGRGGGKFVHMTLP
jgi:hypothetical protein